MPEFCTECGRWPTHREGCSKENKSVHQIQSAKCRELENEVDRLKHELDAALKSAGQWVDAEFRKPMIYEVNPMWSESKFVPVLVKGCSEVKFGSYRVNPGKQWWYVEGKVDSTCSYEYEAKVTHWLEMPDYKHLLTNKR